MYVRAAPIGVMNLWKVDCIEKVPISGLFLWNFSLIDNDYSIIYINENSNDEIDNLLCSAVIKMLYSNINRYKDGIQLFFLDDEFVNEFLIEKDKTEINCTHVNIKNLNYSQFEKIIKYTFKNKDNYRTYDMIQIKKIFSDTSNKAIQSICDEYKKLNNEKYEKIRKNYFRDVKK